MKYWLPMVAIMALPVAGSSAASEFTFGTPAEAAGTIVWDNDEFLLVAWSEPKDRMQLSTTWEGPRSVAIHSRPYWVQNSDAPTPTPHLTWQGQFATTTNDYDVSQVRLVGGATTAATVALSGRGEVHLRGNLAVTAMEYGDCISETARVTQAPFFRRPICTDNSSGLVVLRGSIPKADLRLDRVYEVEWSGLAATCFDSQACLPSTEPQETRFAPPPVETTRTNRTWLETSAGGRPVELSSSLLHIVLVAPRATVAIDGVSRFPLVEAAACGRGLCENGTQTLVLSGTTHLDELHSVGSRNLAASITGPSASLRLDETYVDPESIFGPREATATAVTTIGLLAALKLFAGLFTRISSKEALEHPRRQALMEYITEHPGTTFRELVRETSIPAGTARHHLTVMRRSGLIAEKRHKSTLRFFENHGKYDASWNRVVLLREEPLQELHSWIKAHPAARQLDILDAMTSGNGWSRSTTQHRLRRLVQEGFVTVEPRGRSKQYTAHDTPQAPKPDPWTGLGGVGDGSYT